MTLVVDASVVVSALIDTGTEGRWAEQLLKENQLAAPHLVLVEAANVLRRTALAGDISGDVASLAHADLVDLRVELFAYELVAQRVWDLRENLTAYDAWYVAIAELVEEPLATLDRRLAKASGPTCQFLLPPAR